MMALLGRFNTQVVQRTSQYKSVDFGEPAAANLKPLQIGCVVAELVRIVAAGGVMQLLRQEAGNSNA